VNRTVHRAFPPRHDHDVEAANLRPPSEQLPGPPFCPVALDGRSEFPGRRHAQPRCVGPIDHDEQRHEAAVNFCAGVVDPLELGALANPARRRHYLSSGDGQALTPLWRGAV